MYNRKQYGEEKKRAMDFLVATLNAKKQSIWNSKRKLSAI